MCNIILYKIINTGAVMLIRYYVFSIVKQGEFEKPPT